MESDFVIYGDERMYLIRPDSDAAQIWVDENIETDTVFAGAIPVESRYIQDLCRGILEDGLTVEKDGQRMVEDADGDLILVAGEKE